jgi:cytochrome P450
VLESDLPPEEKGLQRLGDEAQTIVGAGLETTAWALTHAMFHIINQPETLRKLQNELRTAIPDSTAVLDWPHLEELPYLGACIKEAVRLSYGVSTRNPRISPDKPMKYKSWNIPAGTPVSMTTVDVHHDEDVYPNSHSFIPERWLNNPKAENGSSLDRYFVAFGKDARSCLGIKYVTSVAVHKCAQY